ncbi:MAG: aminotransferase class III-fold pyridoxal phosphate-dependent enzyme, partial [Hyphomicrobiales bacterium]|nr:aminotransferase class III-fold pyridoxal phosphate-dependent enzyme [Hyphomicrobiales bacterium]
MTSEQGAASHVLHREFKRSYPVVAGGNGAWLTDKSGKRYLDASGGAAVSCLGHNHPRVVAAMKRQIDSISFAHTSFFTNEPAEELADFLVKRAPEGFGRVYFVSGGSEATESAIKLARQYFLETGEPRRRHVIARWQSYHGNTL